jgi:hypothetical protein
VVSLLAAIGCDGGDERDVATAEGAALPGISGHDETDAVFERLLVADAVEPVARIVDLRTDAVERTFPLQGVARVYAGANGLLGYAVQGPADLVSVIASGLSVQNHGDHAHYRQHESKLLPYQVLGDYPVHFVAHDGYVVVFFDDDGSAHVIDETSLYSEQPRVEVAQTPYPHHGVGLVFHEHLLLSRPEHLNGAERATPTGITVHELDGTATGDLFDGCTSLHGETTQDQHAFFGCVEGVLVIQHGDAGFSGRVIPAPATTATPTPRVGTVVAHPALPHAIGNFGSEALCTIDPAAGTLTPHGLGEAYVQFDVAPGGDALVVLTREGELVVRDPANLDELARLRVTSAVRDDANHGARNPQFGFGEKLLYVSDPERARVHVVDLTSGVVVRSIKVPGVPAKLTVLRPKHGP